MSIFKFHAVTGDDRRQDGQIEAASLSEATQLLLNNGLYPLTISRPGRSMKELLQAPIGGQNISAIEAAQVLADLGYLAAAGVEIAEAVKIMLATTKRKKVRATIEKILDDIRRGRALSEALVRSGSVFPPHAVAIVRAGEASGKLPSALQNVANDLRRTVAVRKQIQTALIYPGCIAVAAIGAVAVLVLVVVPTLQALFAEAASRLPWQARFLVGLSQIMRSHGLAIVTVASLGLIGAVAGLRNESTRARFEKLALKTPGIGSLITAAETARVARLLAVLTASRLPLATAIGFTCDGTRLVISKHRLSVAAARLREGAPLSEALRDVPTLSARLQTLVGIGETTGRLPDMLGEAARGAEQAVAIAIERGLALLTPCMTIVFGLVAGFVLYAVMTAIFSVNDLATMGR